MGQHQHGDVAQGKVDGSLLVPLAAGSLIPVINELLIVFTRNLVILVGKVALVRPFTLHTIADAVLTDS